VGVCLQQECEYDSVEMLSGVDADSKVHGSFCGAAIPQSITSEGNALRVIFSTDSTVQKTGFSAVFVTGRQQHMPIRTLLLTYK